MTAAVLKIEVPPVGRTQRLARRTAVYQTRGSPVRMAVERRTERVNAEIIQILRKTAKYPVEFAFCLTQDSQ
jgi:hypothetical protein